MVAVVALLGILLPNLNPYKATLKEAGVEFTEFHRKKGEISLTFEGDSLGILACRKALNALRTSKYPFDTLLWTLEKEGEILLTGQVENADSRLSSEEQRVETLNESLTVLKLTYELSQNGFSAEVKSEETEGLEGKTVTVTISATPNDLPKAATALPAALEAVNAQGGGIVRCDVLFLQDGGLFAAASYDLVYDDSLFSSAFGFDG